MDDTVKKQPFPHRLILHSSHAGSRRKHGHCLSSEVDVQIPAVKLQCRREGRELLT